MLNGSVGFGNKIGGVMFDFNQNKGDGVYDDAEFDVKDYRFKGELNMMTAKHLL